ncbi:hypothetical protein ASU33_06205 [Solirubrum puertoriconensis]|uniref:DUF2326 domain-containing protein n=1 Tax=Solirubrum puertoriconensis TaxID=1751427 RepID=A0A9X0HJB6_SOLP1|nr:hypothetical protein ASU33_06205 [Solirubrum puertoriconensis]
MNGIGKSTFLDLVDFCLLASLQKTHNPRLYAAKEITDDYFIVLNFRVGGKVYTIKRSTANPKFVAFGELGFTQGMNADEARELLAELIFSRPENYQGLLEAKWFRPLISFYLKVQKFKKGLFADPFKYLAEAKDLDLNVYHLYLLGLDNNLAIKNAELYTELKSLKPAIKKLQHFVSKRLKLKDSGMVASEINKIVAKIKRLENTIDSFRLAEQYKDVENEANELTGKIKELLLQNVTDNKLLADYISTYEQDEKISPQRVAKIYNEISEELAYAVKKSLNEAVIFRQRINISRKKFLSDEIQRLTQSLQVNEKQIRELEERRAKLFTFLSNKNALKDLTESYYILNEQKQHLAEIQANTKLLEQLNQDLALLEVQVSNIKAAYFAFVRENKRTIDDLTMLFYEVLQALYSEENNTAGFSITPDQTKEKVLDIVVTLPDMFGKGKNHGRALLYDLTVAIHNIRTTYNFPRFLVHDGIFDGMDKAHFIATLEFVDRQVENGLEFQYIVTVNEEGSLEDNFGKKELVDPRVVEDEAILVLSPSRKLFGTDFAA